MLRIYLTLCTMLLLPVCLLAQQQVSGKVTDSKKKPLAGVNIGIQGSYDGATTAADGSYSFTTDLTGEQFLTASFQGFQNLEMKIDIKGATVQNIILKASISELKAVTISAGSFEASDEKKGTVLKPLDIATTAGAGADIVNALKTLPGTQQTNDRTGLFVRGGTGYETQTFIDGMLVRNPFSSSLPDVPGRGRFSPFLFKGTTFSSGGYSAQYGQGLSSALILESIDLPDRSFYSVSGSVIGGSGEIERLAKNKKSSWGIEADYTNLGPYLDVVHSKFEPSTNPVFMTTSANFRIKTSKTGMLKFYGYGNWTHMGIYSNSLEHPGYRESFEIHNQNIYTNLSYRENLGNGWKLNSGMSFSTNTDKINTDTIDYSPTAKIHNYSALGQVKLMLTKNLGALSTLRFGAEHQYADEQGAFNQYDNHYIDNYSAAYAETDIYFTPSLVGRAGARFEYSTLIRQGNLAPRISLAYKLGEYSQVSLAYGDYYEKPEQQYLLYNHNMDYMKATHYIASFQRVANNYTFRVEAYYKKYDKLETTYPDTANAGAGYAKGIELFWRDRQTVKNLDYWISYSYIDTKRKYLNYPKEVQPDFAATHTASVVAKYYIASITTNVGLTYSFATGRPYYNPNLPMDKFMSQKTIDYNSIGLSVAYITSIRKALAVVVLSVSNAPDFKQVYGYHYSTDGLRRSEITSNIPRFIYTGIFLNFGADRRQDVIDNL
jgi:vitamin B12 transporter